MERNPTYEELEQRVKELEKEAVERKRIEESLLQEKIFSESLIDSLPGIFYFFDDTGKMLRWNKNFEKVSGYSAKEISNMSPLDFFEKEDKSKVAERIREVFIKGKSSVEAELISKKGNKIPYYFTGALMTIDNKNHLGGMGINITERKLAEEALRESEERYRSLFKNNHSVMLLIDQESADIVDANSAAIYYYGWSHEELTTKKITEINIHTNEQVFQEMEKAKSEQRRQFIFRHRLSNGDIRDVEVYSGPIKLHGQKVLYSIIHDITDRKRAEEALRESEEKFRTIFNSAPVGIAIAEPEGRFIEVNDTVCKMLGYSAEEFREKTFLDITYPNDFAETQRLAAEVWESKRDFYRSEKRYLKKDGSPIWATVNACAVRDRSGEIKYWVGIMEDITERKRIEEALRNSERRLADIISFLPDATFAIDTEGKVIAWNRAIEDLTGVKAEDMIGKGDYEYALPFYKYRRPILIDLVLNKDEETEKTYEYVKKKGEILISQTKNPPFVPEPSLFWNTARPLYNTRGEITGAIEVIRDITDRMLAEEALRKSEGKYRNLFENLYDIYYRTDDKGIITLISPSVERFSGYTPDELIGQNMKHLYVNPQNRDEFLTKLLTDGYVDNFEARLKCKNNSIKWASTNAKLLKDEEGNFVGVEGISRDVSDRKELEYQLVQTQKMESIGTLAGGIAHDFNNILSSVFGYTELALDYAKEGTLQHEHLHEVLRAGRRAKDLVKQILTFSRQVEQEQKPIQVKPIVNEALKLLRVSIPTSIEFKTNVQSNSLIIGDPTKIHQIILNLCTNAAHAMEDGGVLTVSLSNVELDSESLSHRRDLKPGPYIDLTVTDTGHGIPPDVMEKIFDPFFTTKEKGVGTGMGLSVVHGIVHSHDGTIYAYSEPGKGSTFKVYLPAVERRLKPEERVVKPIPTGVERILFIDDEPAIAKVGAQILQSLGYHVVTRTSSIEALELFKEQNDRFDLVITDMTMPHMTGEKLAKELMQIRSDIPVILCTGFSSRINEQKALDIGIRAFISKPILKQEIAETIRRVL